jgi:hypothetical protein
MSQTKAQLVSGTTAQDLTVDNINTTSVNSGQLSNRNIIINGAMKVAQRNTSKAWVGNGYLTCDRWHHTINNSAGRFTSKQTADSPDGLGGKCLELDVTTADTSIASNEHSLLQYKFEGQDVQQLAKGTPGAKKFTVSFYVKGNGNATYMCEFFDRTNTRLIHQQFSVTSSWSRVILTFNNETSNGTINNDNSHEFDMQIWLHAGSDFTSGSYTANTWSGQTNANRAVGISSLFSSTNNFFKITGVQLEVGSTATDFEHRSFAQELALCQRYCYVIKMNNANYSGFVGQAKTTDEAIVIGNAPVPMRDEPTYTGNNIDCQFNGADSSPIIQFDALSIFRVPLQRPVSVLGLRDADVGSLTAGQCILLFAKANGGRMTFDAEL